MGDLANDSFVSDLAGRGFQSLLCCNVLEHVREPSRLCRRLEDLVPAGGYIVVSVPNVFPYHPDPIDTMFRPTVDEIERLFPGSRLVTGSLVDGGTGWEYVDRNPLVIAGKVLHRLTTLHGGDALKGTGSFAPWLFRHFRVTCAILPTRPRDDVNILLASNYFHPEHTGGIETVAHNLVGGYRRAGHRVRWVAADCGSTPHTGAPDDVPLPAMNVTESRFGVPYPLPAPHAIPRLQRAVAWCDVLHVHDCLYPASIALFLLSRSLRRPVLMTQHIGMVPYRSRALRWLLSRAYRTIGRRMLSSTEQVTFVSPVIRDWFATFCDFAAPPVVHVNGVDVGLFRPPDPGERAELRRRAGVGDGRPLLLFVGRFVEKKGLHLLRPLAERRPAWSWLFVGRDDGTNPGAWGVPNVRVLPPMAQPDLRDLYAAADLLVLPSVGEGLPLAALEALACGTPVLTTDETAGNAGELAQLLHSAEPTTDSIEAAIVRLTTSPCARGAALAEQTAERCGWDAVTTRYLEMLEVLAAAGHRLPRPVRM